MPWQVVERKIGRAGDPRQQAARQREWDRRYGPESWAVGYAIDGEFVPQEEAWRTVYCGSFAAHFDAHPNDLQELLATAKRLRNPHAEATGGVDLQVPAVEAFLASRGLALAGREVVDLGTWQGERSHALSERLSPLQVACVLDPKRTLENWWQTKKCLAVWTAD